MILTIRDTTTDDERVLAVLTGTEVKLSWNGSVQISVADKLEAEALQACCEMLGLKAR